MCIYCGTTKYRKIYENHFGPIPKDEEGRSYEIHHHDGNHFNNDPTNFKLVSVQEHYDIHLSLGDWGACFKIAQRMKLSSAEKSMLASMSAKSRVEQGTHNFLGGGIGRKYGSQNQEKRVLAGTHNFLRGVVSKDTVAKRLESIQKKLADGTHPFLGGALQRKTALALVERGIHPGTKVFAQIHICPYCSKQGKGAIMYRHHFDKCKYKSAAPDH